MSYLSEDSSLDEIWFDDMIQTCNLPRSESKKIVASHVDTKDTRNDLTVEQESILFLRHQFGPTLGR